MSLPESFGFAALLVGVVAFGAKLGVDGEPVDVMALIASAFTLGFMATKL
jgi:hypothetical protein